MIRMYCSSDLPTIIDIGNRAWRPIYTMFSRVYGDELSRIVNPDPATAKGEQIRSHCKNYPDRLLICERNGRIVGFLSLHIDEQKKIGEIGNNAVDPSAGERGVGQEMYQGAFEWFISHGCGYVKVITGLDDAHGPARKAYERAGFDIHHENIVYFKKLSSAK